MAGRMVESRDTRAVDHWVTLKAAKKADRKADKWVVMWAMKKVLKRVG